MLGLNADGSDSTQESSSGKESYVTSDDFLANEPNTSKAAAPHKVFHVHGIPEQVWEQGHVIVRKISSQQTQN